MLHRLLSLLIITLSSSRTMQKSVLDNIEVCGERGQYTHVMVAICPFSFLVPPRLLWYLVRLRPASCSSYDELGSC